MVVHALKIFEFPGVEVLRQRNQCGRLTQKNSYMQLLAMLCAFQPLLRDLCQTSAKRFMKPAVV